MENYFSALRGLTESRPAPKFATRIAEPVANIYQWYVCQVDQFIALLDIPKLKEELPKLATSQAQNDAYIEFLNELLIIWNKWKGDVHPAFSASYNKAVKANEKLPGKFDKAIGYLKTLSAAYNEDTMDSLIDKVESMQESVDGVAEKIGELLDDLLNFIAGFAKQKELFSKLCTMILTDKGVKDDAVKKIERSISMFNDKIASNQRTIVGLSIADGLACTFGIAAIIGSFYLFGFSWAAFGAIAVAFIVLGPAIGTTSYFIDKYRKEIKAFHEEISQLDSQKTGLNKEIESLLQIKQLFERLSTDGDKIKGYVQQIMNPWTALSNDLKSITNDIKVDEKTRDPEKFKEYHKAFIVGKTLWSNFTTDIEKLKLPEMKVMQSTVNLEIKTQADLDRILKDAVSIDDFFKRGRA